LTPYKHIAYKYSTCQALHTDDIRPPQLIPLPSLSVIYRTIDTFIMADYTNKDTVAALSEPNPEFAEVSSSPPLPHIPPTFAHTTNQL